MKKTILLLFLLVTNTIIKAQSGVNDGTFNQSDIGFGYGDAASGGVTKTAIQSDGKIIIGGFFNTYNGIGRIRLARLSADGKLDSTFNAEAGPSNPVYAIAIQNDGKIIVGGTFVSYNGTFKRKIVRLNANGSIDTTFFPVRVHGEVGGNEEIYTVLVQNDGKIIIGGRFPLYNGVSRNNIVRIHANGNIDTTFNPGTGANNSIQSAAIQSDGKIIIGGDFTSYNGVNIKCLARLNTNGTLDSTFNPGAGSDGVIRKCIIQSDGKIVISGTFTYYNGSARNRIARINGTGSLDLTFNPGTGANSTVISSSLQSDGKIIIGGSFTLYNDVSKNYITRLNQDGSIDQTFNSGIGADNSVSTTTVLSNGKIIIGGSFTKYNQMGRNRIMRLNANGTFDATFNPGTGTDNQVKAIAIQGNDKIIIGGSFTNCNGTNKNFIARLNNDGTLDTTFNPEKGFASTHPYGGVTTISLQSNEKIIVGGQFTSFNGISRNRIARLNTNGTLDTTFNPGTGCNASVYACAAQSDGKIIIGGQFTSYNGTIKNGIVRLNDDGKIDTTFNIGTGIDANDYILDIKIQNDGKVIICGFFKSYNGTDVNGIIRLNKNGSIDTSFNKGGIIFGVVNTTTLQNDGKIIIGGHINRGIARLNSDGSIDTTFNSSSTGFIDTIGDVADIWQIKQQKNEKIIVAGSFIAYNGLSINNLARLNSNGTIDTSFITGITRTAWNSDISTISIQSHGGIIIGGGFTSYNKIGRNRIARLIGDCINTLGTDFKSACKSYTWIDGKTYTSSTDSPTFALTNATGCDSIVNLSLTITNIDTSITVNNKTITSNQSGATYQWLNCDNNYIALLGFNGQSFTPISSGNYAVKITDGLCIDTSDCANIAVTAVEKFDFEGIKIYPNPIKDNLVIDFTNHLQPPAQVSIFSMEGKVVYSNTSINSTKQIIDIRDWSKGVFIITILGKEGTRTIKLINQ